MGTPLKLWKNRNIFFVKPLTDEISCVIIIKVKVELYSFI